MDKLALLGRKGTKHRLIDVMREDGMIGEN
jgi:hypothetical protein